MIDRPSSHHSARHAPFLDYHHTTAPQGQSGLSVRRDLPILGALLLAFILTLILLMFGSLFIVIPSAPSPRDDSLSVRVHVRVGDFLCCFADEFM